VVKNARGQEFVIGGYTPSPKNFDALAIGHYENGKLIYVARTRNGFTPSLREKLFRRFKSLHTTPAHSESPGNENWTVGRRVNCGKDGRMPLVKPVLVGQFEFAEWTPDNHLRHSRFIALREDKDARDVRREGWQEFAAVERLPIGNLKHS
jgi:ATP-dependent DNA ligase